MTETQLIIGNRRTDAWSMSAWLAVQHTDLDAREMVIAPSDPKTAEATIARYSPSGSLPVLIANDVKIWDCLAIIEFLAELAPKIWPTDPWHRAHARSICCEIHNDTAAIRHFLPMECGVVYEPPGMLLAKVEREIERVRWIISTFRPRMAAQGDFLFGPFSAADMMLAPVICSFATHQIPMSGVNAEYCQAVLENSDVGSWIRNSVHSSSDIETPAPLPDESDDLDDTITGARKRHMRPAPSTRSQPAPRSAQAARSGQPEQEWRRSENIHRDQVASEQRPPTRNATVNDRGTGPVDNRLDASNDRSQTDGGYRRRDRMPETPALGIGSLGAAPPPAEEHVQPILAEKPPRLFDDFSSTRTMTDASEERGQANRQSEPVERNDDERLRKNQRAEPPVKPIGGGIHRRR